MYIGRFAPSPTGPLHAGSLSTALASWLDARAHGGQWLIRIEDTDAIRCDPAATGFILQQLARCGLQPDCPPEQQSHRTSLYEAALKQLVRSGIAYPCACSRSEIAQSLATHGQTRTRGQPIAYPGTCRPANGGPRGRPARAWRLDISHPSLGGSAVRWIDRRLGAQHEEVAQTIGDFILKRADGPWAYQLAVVVDDAEQGVTHVVRGSDVADNTARQILLQRALGLPTPIYLHVPLVLGPDGEKLSKQAGAAEVNLDDPAAALAAAAAHLGLGRTRSASTGTLLVRLVEEWKDRYV